MNARLEKLLGDRSTVVVALDPLGASCVPVPDDFGVPAERVLEAPTPLDLLEPSTYGAAVAAFEHARLHGLGGSIVRFIGDELCRSMEVVDVTAEHGCFLAVFTPHDGETSPAHGAGGFVPRRAAYDLGVTGVIQRISADFTALLGWDEADVVGGSALSIVHPDDHEAGIAAWVDLIESNGGATRLRQRFRHKDGSWVWCEPTARNDLDHDPPRIRGELIDISREVAAEQELQRREAVLDRLYRALPSGVVVLAADGTLDVENDRWVEFVGASRGRPLARLFEQVADRDAVVTAVTAAMEAGSDADLAVEFPDGAICRYATLHIRPLVEAGRQTSLLMTLDDETDRRLHEQQLAVQSRRDPLTGVLNRRGVEEQLRERLGRGTAAPLSVLYLDIDDFKSVNDLYGHAAGDELLCAVVARVTGGLRDGDVVGRVGGDEFVVLVDGPPSEARRVAARLQGSVDRLAEELPVTDAFGLSIGTAHRQADDDFDSLVRRADVAMYDAKMQRRIEAGRDRRRGETTITDGQSPMSSG